MPYYRYVARQPDGQQVTSVVEGANQNEVINTLMASGTIVLSIEMTDSSSTQSSGLSSLFQPKVKVESFVIFCRQMYSLMKAGIPLLRAMRGLAESTADKPLKEALERVSHDLSQGQSLSNAMTGSVFSDLFISLIKVGENTGRLDQSMLQLAEYFEKEIDTIRRIRAAFRYPSFVFMVLFGAVIFLNFTVIPQFVGIFSKFGADLPLPTMILMSTSAFMIEYWWILALSCAGIFFVFNSWKNSKSGGIEWDKFKIRMPLVGELVNMALMSRFSRTFSLMLSAGVPLNVALKMAGEALDNKYLLSEIEKMRAAVESGVNLSAASAGSTLFTPLVHQMIQVGEETGQIDQLLLEVSDFYDREVEYNLTRLSARIEPILLLIVAGMVLLLAMGIFLPMWNMLDLIKQG